MIHLHKDHQTLAEMLCAAFDSPQEEARFLIICRKYPQTIIYRAMQRARQVPAEQIKKSRVALFYYLVKSYSHAPNNPRP